LPQTTIKKLSTTYANVWTSSFWRVLDSLRILCAVGNRA